MGSNDAIIKVRLDTGGAEADLRRLESAFGKVQGAAFVGAGGGRGGGGSMFGGGFSLGNLLPTIAGVSLGAAAFGTLAGDAFGVARGGLDFMGRGVSSFLGMAGTNAKMKSIDRAAAMAAEAFGPTKPSDAAISSIMGLFRKVTDPEEETRRRIEDMAGVDKKDEVVKWLEKIYNAISDLPNSAAKGAVDMLPDDFFRWWGNTFGMGR